MIVIVATELCLEDGSKEARADFRETLRNTMAVSTSSAAKAAFTNGVGKLKAAQSVAYKAIGQSKRTREDSPTSAPRARGPRGAKNGGGGQKCNFCGNRGHTESVCNIKANASKGANKPHPKKGAAAARAKPDVKPDPDE